MRNRSPKAELLADFRPEQGFWPNIIMLFREAFNVLKEAGCSDEALCYEMWMSKEPAEIFERAAEEGFITQASDIRFVRCAFLDFFF